MNLKDLPEGLPAKIIKFDAQPNYIGWIVRKEDIKLLKFNDPASYWNNIYDIKMEVELDYNTPFSIKYLPEGYVAGIVDINSDNSIVKEHIGKKVKITNSPKYFATILVNTSVKIQLKQENIGPIFKN